MPLTIAQAAGTILSSATGRYRDTQANATKRQLTTSANQKVFSLRVDNSLNASTDVFLKMYNSLEAGVTVGTTAPDFVMRVKAGKIKRVQIPRGMKFTTAITVALVATDGGTGGTNNPGSSVDLRIATGA